MLKETSVYRTEVPMITFKDESTDFTCVYISRYGLKMVIYKGTYAFCLVHSNVSERVKYFDERWNSDDKG